MCLAAWLGGGSKTFWFGSFVSLVILIELWLSAHIALLSFVNSGPLVVTSLSFTRFTLCIGKITRWWSRPAGLGVWFWVGFLGSSFFSPPSVFSSLPSTMTWAPRPHSWRKKTHSALTRAKRSHAQRPLFTPCLWRTDGRSRKCSFETTEPCLSCPMQRQVLQTGKWTIFKK